MVLAKKLFKSFLIKSIFKMNISNAQELLSSSISNLKKYRGSISVDEIQTETINVTCKYIIEKYNGQIKQVHEVNEINRILPHNYSIVYHDVVTFVQAARELYPSQTLSTHPQTGQSWSESTVALIIPNICWAGMWGFLRSYFLQNHRIAIDSVNVQIEIFNSARHIRYEGGAKTNESEVNRVIKLVFSEGSSVMEVSISPSLSPKTAKLANKIGNKHLYIGDDRDYQFLVLYDEFDDIEQFELIMPNRALKIVYHGN